MCFHSLEPLRVITIGICTDERVQRRTADTSQTDPNKPCFLTQDIFSANTATIGPTLHRALREFPLQNIQQLPWDACPTRSLAHPSLEAQQRRFQLPAHCPRSFRLLEELRDMPRRDRRTSQSRDNRCAAAIRRSTYSKQDSISSR
jgi:hypothetical protein